MPGNENAAGSQFVQRNASRTEKHPVDLKKIAATAHIQFMEWSPIIRRTGGGYFFNYFFQLFILCIYSKKDLAAI